MADHVLPGRRLQLSSADTLGCYRVHLDGADISNALLKVDLTLASGHVPKATVDLRIFEASTMELEHAEVIIPSKTVDLLVRLGWTPPGSEPATEAPQ